MVFYRQTTGWQQWCYQSRQRWQANWYRSSTSTPPTIHLVLPWSDNHSLRSSTTLYPNTATQRALLMASSLIDIPATHCQINFSRPKQSQRHCTIVPDKVLDKWQENLYKQGWIRGRCITMDQVLGWVQRHRLPTNMVTQHHPLTLAWHDHQGITWIELQDGMVMHKWLWPAQTQSCLETEQRPHLVRLHLHDNDRKKNPSNEENWAMFEKVIRPSKPIIICTLRHCRGHCQSIYQQRWNLSLQSPDHPWHRGWWWVAQYLSRLI